MPSNTREPMRNEVLWGVMNNSRFEVIGRQGQPSCLDLAEMPKSPRFSPNPVRVIDVLAYPAVQVLDVTGPVQVFATANDLVEAAGGARPYEVRVVAQGG